ncbi:MAG: NAD(P)/FAD-dependent oxidoreductase [Bdellovibrionales bacterium]|nr:NAD(P)/FAD-dependent oxidoreductase [Bdellovibrionales bacterium]
MGTPDGNKADYNTIIIGASISGSLAASLLGRAGKDVLLVDPQSFPRRKACGEGLSIVGQRYLEEFGFWTEEVAAHAKPFYGYTIHHEDGAVSNLGNNDSVSTPQGYGISRVLLDSRVYKAALDCPSVELSTGLVRAVEKFSSGWVVTLSNGDEVRSRNLVVACGGGASALFPELEVESASEERYGLALWLRGRWFQENSSLGESHRKVKLSTIHIHHQPEGQYIITPLSKTRINVSILLSKGSSSKLSKQDILQQAFRLVKKSGFEISTLIQTRGAAAIHSSRLALDNHPAYIVGDAVERFDPIGGMGMTHGILSASLAVRHILLADDSPERGLARYYRERGRVARLLRVLTNMSYGLNVSKVSLVRQLVTWSPSLALVVMAALKSQFPRSQQFAEVFEWTSGQAVPSNQFVDPSSADFPYREMPL